MARRYVRDAKGRFASKGYSGQSGGRGARLKSGKGNTRAGGGTKVSGPSATGSRSGTIKAKKVSEGQQYARRVKAGKDVSAAKPLQAKTAAKRVATADAMRRQRAQSNLARTADTRNKPGSTMIRRPSQKTVKSNLRAEKALEFYKDPKKALRSVNKKRKGFKLPRGMR